MMAESTLPSRAGDLLFISYLLLTITHERSFTTLPLLDYIWTELLQCVKSARAIPVNPLSGWKPAVATLWKAELDRLSVLFNAALTNPTPLSLFNALFAFVCRCFERRVNSVVFDSPDDTVNAALRRILKGQERKALKSLCSNGVATVNASTIAAVKKLHPTGWVSSSYRQHGSIKSVSMRKTLLTSCF